jgi:hypothetical protein
MVMNSGWSMVGMVVEDERNIGITANLRMFCPRNGHMIQVGIELVDRTD